MSNCDRLNHIYKAIGVPRRMRENLLQLKSTDPLRRTRLWAESPKEWCLVLSGRPGTGKSSAASWWLWSEVEKLNKRWVDSGYPQGAPMSTERKWWWQASELMRLGMYSDVWQSIEAADAMVLDDPGTEFLDRAGSMGVRMDGLLDARYREIRKTLITTNLCVEDFSARYGERVMDRIRDGGCFYEFTAESMRR